MDFLARDVRRFKRKVFPGNRAIFRRLAATQSPRVLFNTCADSRILQFDERTGTFRPWP